MYISARKQTVGVKPDGTPDVRSPGDPIPEAASWPNLRAYVRVGDVRWDPAQAPGLRELVALVPKKALEQFAASQEIDLGESPVDAVVNAFRERMRPPL